MSEIKDIMLICAQNGINAISSSEESLYPWNSSPYITKEIDEIAKKNNCTISGTGANEPQYGGIASLCVGLSPEDFETDIAKVNNITEADSKVLIEKGEFMPSYVWNINGCHCVY